MKAGRTSDSGEGREAAFRILSRVERAGAYASILLEHAEGRLGDPRDVAQLHHVVLGVLRRRTELDHAIDAVCRRSPDRVDPQVRIVLRIGAYALFFLDRVPDFAAVDSAVRLANRHAGARAGGFVNGVLRELARRGSALLPPPPQRGDVAALARFRSHPRWWTERVVARLGWDTAAALLEADNLPAPTTLRANLRRTTPARLAAELAGQGVETAPGRFAPAALRVVSGGLRGCGALRRGDAWIQDEASQIVPALFGSEPRGSLADLCAAPGGKTLQLADALGPGGTILAVDRNPRRLAGLADRARTCGVRGLRLVAADMAAASPVLRGAFDHVLVDAPCSGTGTLRRHPEIRWRLAPGDLERLAARQLALLSNAAALCRRGAALVYSVCSLEPEEGEQVVEQVLARRPEFALDDPRGVLPEACREFVDARGFLRTSPLTGGLDGFFAARLVRIGL